MKLPDYTSMGRDLLIQEHKTMLENLTNTQNRCTELVNENRKLKKLVSKHCYRDPSVIGCCAGPKACSCECNICEDPNG